MNPIEGVITRKLRKKLFLESLTGSMTHLGDRLRHPKKVTNMDFIEEIYKLDGSYNDLDNLECSPIHRDLTYRMKKTLYAADKTETDADGIPIPLNDIVVELFQTSDQPRINLAQRHVGNITKRARVTQCSTFLGMLYARRLKRQNPEFLTRVTSAELFLISMMLATKFLYDEGEDEEFFNDEWAHVGKLDVKRVHELERDFLDALDWNLFVDPMEFFEFLQTVETRIALNQGNKRGWFSYTDLFVLMNTPEWHQICLNVIEQSVKIVCVCAMVYSLCAAAMIWSGVMLHHAQVPHRPCHGRVPLPFGLQHTKTTRPWQPNPVLDQLLFTFLLRLPVNADPLGLTYDHSSTWCSLPTVAENDDDIGNTTPTSKDDRVDLEMETGYNHDQNSSEVDQQGSDRHLQDKEQILDDDVSDETQGVIAKANVIQEALVIFYHALISALWEIEEVTDDPLDDSNMAHTQPKRSCPYQRNQNVKSSCKRNATSTLTNQSQITALPHQTPSDTGASDTRTWDSHGTHMSGHAGFTLQPLGSHMGFTWYSNNTAQQCIYSKEAPYYKPKLMGSIPVFF